MEVTVVNPVNADYIKEIQDFVVENTFGSSNNINPDTLIFKEGYFDSMGFVSLISFLEEKFSVQIDSDDLVEENFESINAISNFVKLKIHA